MLETDRAQSDNGWGLRESYLYDRHVIAVHESGHALIANEILTLLNNTFGAGFQTVNLNNIVASDPAVRFSPTAKVGGLLQ